MTREEELEQLIAEQRADDTGFVKPEPRPKFVTHTSLDRTVNESGYGVGIGGGEMFVGVEYDFDAMIESGDYEAQGELVPFLGGDHIQHGMNLRAIPHGTYNGYKNYNCRCSGCLEAGRAYCREHQRRYQKRRRAEELANRPAIQCGCCGTSFVPGRKTQLFCKTSCAERASARRQRGAAISDAEFIDKRRKVAA